MPPKAFNAEKAMKSKTININPKISSKINAVRELQIEIEKIKEEKKILKEKIEKYEKDSELIIFEFREKIDEKTTKMNLHKKNSEFLKKETEIKKLELISQNEKEKEKIKKENEEIIEKINESEKSLKTILEFEKNKIIYMEKIQNLEADIERIQKNTKDDIENIENRETISITELLKRNHDNIIEAE